MADTTATPTPDAGAQAAPGTTPAPENGPTTTGTDSTDQNGAVQDASDSTEDSGTAEVDDQDATGETPDAQDATGDPEAPVEDDAQDATDSTDDDADADDMPPKARKALGKARREASNLRTRLHAEQVKATRLEVAMASGIPADAVEFLHGDTREAMESSAEKLLVMMGYNDRVAPPGGPVETGGNPRRGDFTSANQARLDGDLDTIGARIYKH